MTIGDATLDLRQRDLDIFAERRGYLSMIMSADSTELPLNTIVELRRILLRLEVRLDQFYELLRARMGRRSRRRVRAYSHWAHSGNTSVRQCAAGLCD